MIGVVKIIDSTMARSGSTNLPNSVGAALAGSALVVAGRRKGGVLGLMAGLAGVGLIVQAAYEPLRRLVVRTGAARRAIHLRFSVVIDRPVHEVFEFCHDFENFPRIIGGLHSVVDHQDGRSHWTVVTPSGRTIEWDAVVTKYVPNSVIAWESVRSSIVQSSGLLRFSPSPNGGTRLDLQVDYEPVSTSVDEALHALFDVPIEEQLRADLARVSFYLGSRPNQSDHSVSETRETEPALP